VIANHFLRDQADKIPKLVDVIAAGNAALLKALDDEPPAPIGGDFIHVDEQNGHRPMPADDLLTPLLTAAVAGPVLTAAQIAASLPNRKIRLER
jgi:hypothetical protein